jgi:hypothetical protein
MKSECPKAFGWVLVDAAHAVDGDLLDEQFFFDGLVGVDDVGFGDFERLLHGPLRVK